MVNFHIVSGFSQNAFDEFCQILLSPTTLKNWNWQTGVNLSVGWYFRLSQWVRWKNKKICWNLLSVVGDDSFLNWIIVFKYQENMSFFLCYSQYTYRYTFKSKSITKIFSIIFLNLDNQIINQSFICSTWWFLWYKLSQHHISSCPYAITALRVGKRSALDQRYIEFSPYRYSRCK